MAKPDDVSQEAWDAAQQINLTLPYSHVQGRIARAIMAAEAEERQVIIVMAEEMAIVAGEPSISTFAEFIRMRDQHVNAAHTKNNPEV